MDGGGGFRVEAERWLTISEKLLAARDLHGAKSFAIRARESDPRLVDFADQLIAVADTLLAGELRTNNNNHDYYAILQVARLTQSIELVANQYRKLAMILNPTRNRVLFADQAFKLVADAWVVLSDPARKAMYDHELQLSQLGQLGQLGQLQQGQFAIPEHLHLQLQQQQHQQHQQQLHAGHLQQPPQQQQFLQVSEPVPVKKGFRTGREGKSVVEEDSPTQPLLTPEPTRPPTQHATQRSQSILESSRPPRQMPPPAPEPSRSTPTPTPTPAPTPTPVPPPTQTPAPTPPAAVAEKPRESQPEAQSRTGKHTQGAQKSRSKPEVPSFWTACPYCYIIYEYPKVYEECTLRCQGCRRAFHAVKIPSPPVSGKDTSFCCWGFFPLGFSANATNRGWYGSSWSPFSAMFATPLQKPKVVYKDDVYVDLSDSSKDESDSDDEWDHEHEPKRAKNWKGKGPPCKSVTKPQNERGRKGNDNQKVDGGDGGGSSGYVQEDVVVVGAKGEGTSGKRKAAKDLGKLDLNVMFSNEVEEAVPGVNAGRRAVPGVTAGQRAVTGVNAGQRAGHGEEDNIEGIGFFEGLDEFLSSLPILSVVGDDKVKAN